MRKLYYRPQKVSPRSLVGLAVLSVVVVAGLRSLPPRWLFAERWAGKFAAVPDLGDRMLDASHRASSAFDAIHCHRIELGHPLLDVHDPADTGMIGPSMSLVTTLPGHLDAKQTSVNPNFAAVAMRLLVDAGVRPGDRIAIGCTGSFPALNIAVYCAAEALDLRPVIISSAASSQYGANSADLMWPDMERLLAEGGLIESRSRLISRGGFKDRAAGMDDETRAILEASITRSGIPLMDSVDDADAIERRMLAYADAAEDETYAVYINVGGGDASVGGTVGNDTIGEGLIRPSSWSSLGSTATEARKIDCVASRFLASGTPVINMINVVALAKQYELPIASTVPVEVGQGGVYQFTDPRRVLAFIGILVIGGATGLVLRPPVSWVHAAQKRGYFGGEPESQPQWMV